MSSAGRAIKTVVHLELLLEAEGCLIEEKRVAVKASTGPKCGALRQGLLKALGSASFHQAVCAQELISSNGRLSARACSLTGATRPPALAGP